MTYKRRKNVRGDGHLKKSWRTKRRTKDLDEIDEDIKDENAKKLLNQEIDLDKPGAAQHYCVHCAKYFINPRALEDHFRTKVHKRRLKALEVEPYTIEESERAAGHGSWTAAKKRKIETLTPDSFDVMQADEQETVKSKVLSLTAMSSTLLRWSKISACSARFMPIRHGSALFIPGSKASENFALLSPHLDFDSRFADVAKLRRELALRGSTEDPEELARSWEFYKCVNANKWTLERRRSEIAYRMKKLNKTNNLSADEEKEKMQLTTEGKVLRQDMRIIKETLWEMEETVVTRALKLPNEIDSKTPESSVILRTIGEIREPPSDTERKSHVDIGTNLGLLEYKNPMHCYLCDDAALLELGALSLAGEILVGAEMMRVAGTDFGRSLVVEGSGLDHEDPTAAFVLLNNEGIDWETCNRLHLVGGASLVAFLAMHTKQLINPNGFPLKYFATGRQYAPLADGASPNGLFTVCQSSVAHAFVMVKDPLSDEYNVQFDDLVRTVTKLYDSLDVHYRVVMRSAGELRPWESLRVSFELWSAHSRRYVEVGYVSRCGQYFSKRLLIAYQTPTGRDYPAVISGTVLNVPRLLACLLEEDTERLRIPTEIARHMPGIH